MKILMVTPRIDRNDPIFGFTVSWIKELAKYVESLYIITLRKSNEKLPNNVKCFYVNGNNFFTKFISLEKLYFLVIPKVDVVFTHMYNEFAILAWLPVKIHDKKLITWYAHSAVTLRLKLTNLLVDKMISSNKNAFRLKSKKIEFVGQGINTDLFKLQKIKKSKVFQLITAGRISPVKRLEFLINGLYRLREYGLNAKLIIVGGTSKSSDESYLRKIKQQISKLNLNNHIILKGPVTQSELSKLFQKSDLYVHACFSGLDKTTLEAMSSRVLIVSCNYALKEILTDHPHLLYDGNNINDFVKKTTSVIKKDKSKKEKLGIKLRKVVLEDNSVNILVKKIMKTFNELF